VRYQGPVVLLVGAQWGQWWLFQGEPQGVMQAGGDEGYLEVGSILLGHGRMWGQGLIHQVLKICIKSSSQVRPYRLEEGPMQPFSSIGRMWCHRQVGWW